jgi:hypothetical protein
MDGQPLWSVITSSRANDFATRGQLNKGRSEKKTNPLIASKKL